MLSSNIPFSLSEGHCPNDPGQVSSSERCRVSQPVVQASTWRNTLYIRPPCLRMCFPWFAKAARGCGVLGNTNGELLRLYGAAKACVLQCSDWSTVVPANAPRFCGRRHPAQLTRTIMVINESVCDSRDSAHSERESTQDISALHRKATSA